MSKYTRLAVVVGLLVSVPGGDVPCRADEAGVESLVKILFSGSPGERQATMRALKKLGPKAEAAVPGLIDALKSSKPHAPSIAARALGEIGPAADAAVNDLIRVLGRRHANRWLIRNVIVALGKIGPTAVARLTSALASDDKGTRAGVAEVLGEIGPPAKTAIPKLVVAMGDSNHIVCVHAAAALRKIAPKDKTLVGKADQTFEKYRARLAATIKGPQVTGTDGAAALFALGRMGPAAKPVIDDMIGLFKKDFTLRATAAEALGLMGPVAVPQLAAALKDKNWHIVEGAARALAFIGPPAKPAVPQLIAVVGARGPVWTLLAAMDALGRIGPDAKDAVDVLRRTLKAKTHLFPAARSSARAVMTRGTWILVSRAAGALGGIGPSAKAAVGDLTTCLKHKHPAVRYRAAQALGKIGPAAKSAVAALKEAENDTDVSVGYAAAEAVKRIQK